MRSLILLYAKRVKRACGAGGKMKIMIRTKDAALRLLFVQVDFDIVFLNQVIIEFEYLASVLKEG
jgi:hypothetical protein